MSHMTKKQLFDLYSNQQVTDFMKGLNAIEISDLRMDLAGPHDITQSEAYFLDALINEMAYRESNPLLRTRSITEEMSESEAAAAVNYNHIARMVSQDEADLSVSYLSSLGVNTNGLFDRYPMMLSIENFSVLYEVLSNSGYSDEDIQSMLVNDLSNVSVSEDIFKSASKRRDAVKTNLTSDKFKAFVKKTVDTINSQSLCQRVVVK